MARNRLIFWLEIENMDVVSIVENHGMMIWQDWKMEQAFEPGEPEKLYGLHLIPGGMGCNKTGSFKGHSLPGWSSPYLGFVVGHT
jgi:hypothetical protein